MQQAGPWEEGLWEGGWLLLPIKSPYCGLKDGRGSSVHIIGPRSEVGSQGSVAGTLSVLMEKIVAEVECVLVLSPK